ncbi:MAG: hypothetical protein SFZ23_12840 [Planctomycetota bacterium]|nr:hypothetical protein [Planctomycetota bacterium]
MNDQAPQPPDSDGAPTGTPHQPASQPGAPGAGGPATGGLAPGELAWWQQRATQAEERMRELQDAKDSAERAAAKARDEATRSNFRRQLERELSSAGAVDLDAARLLVEAQLDTGGATVDARALVAALRDRKPHLFGATQSRRASAMAPAARVQGSPIEMLDDLAAEARASGDRSLLLRYLRARRR